MSASALTTAPITGWSRERWAQSADDLLAAVSPWASPEHALITMPGASGGYGRAVDGLEGFARTFLLAGFRLAGERGADPHGYAEYYARGLAAGTDPDSPERWTRLSEHGQAKVEAASIALILDMTRPWIWDQLDSRVQANVITYLAEAVGDDTYPRINWVWFRLVVQTFLRSVGGPHSLTEMAADLATHDSFIKADGWLADGDTRAFDHYTGWALHLYPTLWARMQGAEDLAAPRSASDRALLDRFLSDAVHLVGADGAPLIQGRSLVYRFAAAAPFWVGAFAEVPSTSLGVLRRAASGVMDYFASHGVPNSAGLLDLGWHHEWRQLAQSYSGTGSAYWASKGMLGLALPADHPVWQATEEPLPLERGNDALAIAAPSWVVSGTKADGIVRLANHGVDHTHQGEDVGDSPLYARLGYSTATFPLLNNDAWIAPLDQSVVLVDAAGRRSHRAGFEVHPLSQPDADGAVTASSTARAHWISPADDQESHGSGIEGHIDRAASITVTSVLRADWEVRLVHLAEVSDLAVALEVGGWPLAGATEPQAEVSGVGATVTNDQLRADLVALTAVENLSVRIERPEGASPLGEHSAVAILSSPPAAGWRAYALSLAGLEAATAAPRVEFDATHSHALIVWADGRHTTVRLPLNVPTPAAGT